ncbi:MAG: hypothetical protein IPK17_29330 [Chloroflexi bacterium]|uniref:hypothetical protein n=1 Tax=Candidatus Flexifilum breve TaxID=3140694 RepID=UPI0031373383|nr:hypothetical protein [Chloroflexota bacterium]
MNQSLTALRHLPRRSQVPWILLAVLSLLSGWFGVVALPAVQSQSSDPVIGYRSHSFANAGYSSPTEGKAQSTLWWNDGVWWADMLNAADQSHHIYRLNEAEQTWEDTGTVLDERARVHSDCLWDETTQKLYVISHVSDNIPRTTRLDERGFFYRYSYDPLTQQYTRDAGFPVVVTPGSAQTITLAKDSLGQLWITYVFHGQVMVRRTNGDDHVWTDTYPLPAVDSTTALNDISAIIAFSGQIGVAWSNRERDSMHFAVHVDGAPDDQWTEEIITAGFRAADNHLHLAVDANGIVYVAGKTSARGNDPLLMLYVRQAPNTWAQHVFGYNHDGHTRAIILIDNAHRRLYMFATAPESGGGIYYKATSLDEIAFAAGLGTPILRYPNATRLNNVTSTKQTVTSATGIVVLASDRTTTAYYYNVVPVD